MYFIQARRQRWIRITDRDTKQGDSKILFAQPVGIRRQKAKLPQVPLEKRDRIQMFWKENQERAETGLGHIRGEKPSWELTRISGEVYKIRGWKLGGCGGEKELDTTPIYFDFFFLHFPILGWGSWPRFGMPEIPVNQRIINFNYLIWFNFILK